MRRSAAGLAWHAAAALSEPALRLMLIRRRRAGKEIAGRLHERRGIERESRPPGRLLWVHAASVGETNAVLPVLGLLASAGTLSILLTTATASAARLLERRLPALGLSGSVRHRMAPLDVPRWIECFLDAWRPDAAVFVESELWPNVLAALRRRGTQAALINARLSEPSARAWRRVPGLAAEMLGAFGTVWARSEEDARRLARLGRPVDAIGDLKAAVAPPDADAAELQRLAARLDGRPRWLAASTHPGEEEIVAAADALLRAAHPGLLTIVAPRHPERGAAIAALLGAAPRRSSGEGPTEADFWIADTLGEMGLLYRLAPIVLIGRSLGRTASGGQNPLEAARLGCALAIGPHHGNFAASVATLRRADALAIVADAGQIAAWVARLIDDPDEAGGAGARAEAASIRADGLLERTASMLAALAEARG